MQPLNSSTLSLHVQSFNVKPSDSWMKSAPLSTVYSMDLKKKSQYWFNNICLFFSLYLCIYLSTETTEAENVRVRSSVNVYVALCYFPVTSLDSSKICCESEPSTHCPSKDIVG